ncbi:MAG: ribonuclease HII [Candidatus Poseidoniia archaeon]|jgi:ribonuclease HII|nr:ribonuclease HII [Euryarchaeota archaeon]MDP6534332.1 ribonuclease HII [Candidatus Poseidoniia archaeon]MDP6834656.1 ribonuclease HII [Candidatus Poseidoniia archaeon]|tara:strand:- start:390 stop:1073 length:684 start_codon:yes stop_codon:yes gene_type:complete
MNCNTGKAMPGLIAGIDEAGRGPVLGPMAVAIVAIEEDKVLREIGVRDSKQLSSRRRRELSIAIRQSCECAVELIEPVTIDRWVAEGGLNRLEERAFARLITQLAPTVAFIDSPELDGEKVGHRVSTHLPPGMDCQIIAQTKADQNIPVVAAASILAKEAREAAMERLKDELGDCGSGYPSDEQTITFLKQYRRERGKWPPGTRKSWKTLKRIEQKVTLDDFGENDG